MRFDDSFSNWCQIFISIEKTVMPRNFESVSYFRRKIKWNLVRTDVLNFMALIVFIFSHCIGRHVFGISLTFLKLNFIERPVSPIRNAPQLKEVLYKGFNISQEKKKDEIFWKMIRKQVWTYSDFSYPISCSLNIGKNSDWMM